MRGAARTAPRTALLGVLQGAAGRGRAAAAVLGRGLACGEVLAAGLAAGLAAAQSEAGRARARRTVQPMLCCI